MKNIKIKMIGRYGAVTGKILENGLTYEFPQDYAMELVKFGHAVLMPEEEIVEEIKFAWPQPKPRVKKVVQ